MARRVDREAVGCGVIEKRGNWWHFRWTGEGGDRRRESLKVTTKDAARTKANALSLAIEDQNWTPRVARKQLRFEDVAEEYVEHVRQSAQRTGGVEYERSTAEGYASILRRMKAAAPFVNDYIGSVTPASIEEWLNARQDRDGIALATRNRELSFVKSVYRWVVEAKGLGTNPATRVKVVAHEDLDPRRRQTRALTVEELERLLAKLRERGGLVYDVCLCAADTGLRRGSLQALRWKHTDWREGLLRLPTSKGKKALEVTLTERLSGRLQAMYEQARSKTINGTVVLTASVEELPIFPSHHDVTKPFDNVRKGLIRAAKEAGIGHVTLHMLRHSYCTQSADAGVPAFVLQEQMGHRHLATTQKYYHASREGRRQATSLLEQVRSRVTADGAS
ncbi:MAG: tyrosine-type recombinase/integrase [Candidatus Latescibacterota bacterium]